MANSFDFELKADDQVSASIQRIDEAVKNLLPNLTKTQDGLKLGGQESLDGLDKLVYSFKSVSSNARDGVQFIGDLVPPLKMVAGLSVGIGGLGTVLNAVKNGLDNFANRGYQIETTAKNVSMTTNEFQKLTGAMVENGAARDKAESSINDLYTRANNAVQGRDGFFMALMASNGIGISKTKEGVADVNKLLDDMNKRMLQLSPALQAVFGNAAGLSPEMLNYLRQTTDQIQQLKDQAQRDGLIWSPQTIKNADELYKEFNKTSAAWDGLKMRFDAGIGGMMAGSTTGTKLASARNKVSQDQNIIDTYENDEYLKSQLSDMDRAALKFGILTDAMRKKYQARYGARDAALQLQDDVKGLYVKPPSPVMTPRETPQEQHRFSQLENKYNLPQGMLSNVYSAESSNGKNLYSRAGAEGPFQFMPDTGKDYGLNNRQDRLDFDKSSEASARYLADLLTMFNGDVKKAVAAYNWGPKRVKAYGLYQAPAETREYLAKVMPGLPDYSPSYTQDGQDNKPVVTPPYNINASNAGGNQGQGMSYQNIVAALSDALKDNKTQVEITLVNSATGEKTTLTARGQGRVTTSMDIN